MGREVRRVPADWVHPTYVNRRGERVPRPMHPWPYEENLREWEETTVPEWLEGQRLWYHEGLVKTYGGNLETIAEVLARTECYRRPKPGEESWDWYAGPYPSKPQPEDYMPQWSNEERTHYMMYEDTSEGTPISPAFATPEELARWLADTGASAFADQTASYDAWLKMILGPGFSVSAVMVGGKFASGVEAAALLDD